MLVFEKIDLFQRLFYANPAEDKACTLSCNLSSERERAESLPLLEFIARVFLMQRLQRAAL